MTTYNTATEAIDRSVSHNEIVHVEFSSIMFIGLICECEDNVEARAGMVDLWGTTDAGDDWRVQMTGCPAGCA